MAEVKTHEGSCHCGAVAYKVDMALDGLIECNCSHCYRKGLVLNFVTPDAFRLTAGGPQTEYQFNTHKITTCSARPVGSSHSRAARHRTASRWWRSTSAP